MLEREKEQVLPLEPKEKPKLYKIRKTVFQMLLDRGYEIEQEDLEENLESFTKTYSFRHELSDFFKSTSGAELIYIHYSDKIKTGVNEYNTFIDTMDAKGAKNGIFIVREISNQAKKSLNEATDGGINLQIFEENELVVNITENELVPRHLLLNEADKQSLLKKYKLKEHQLPKILSSDPIAKYLGARRGQAVKILRKSDTTEQYITYRITV